MSRLERVAFRGAWTLALAAVCAGFVRHALEYLSYFPDDAYISLRYCQRLLEGNGLTWTDGERVEGYTNFLWVVLVAAIGLVHRDLLAVAQWLGVVLMPTALLSLALVYRSPQPRNLLAVLAGGTLFALTGSAAAYAPSGLENALLVAAVAAAIAGSQPLLTAPQSSFRAAALPGCFLGLAVLTRPDAIVLAAGLCGGLWGARGFGREGFLRALRLGCYPLAFQAAHLAFRRAYYGDWVPNTFHAKVALTPERMERGLDYILALLPWAIPHVVALCAATLVALFAARPRRNLWLVVVPTWLWLLYVVVIGGDIFNHHRMLVYPLVLAAFLMAELVRQASFLGRRSHLAICVACACLLANLATTYQRDPERDGARNDSWHKPGKEIGEMLAEAFKGQKPLLAVDAAGTVPFHSGLPALDMLGLNDRYIATHPPRGFGKGYIGHELGDGPYLLKRAPDLVQFRGAGGSETAAWLGGRQMQADPSFNRDYRLVTFETQSHMRTVIWVHTRSPRIGMRWEAGTLIVPGFLFAPGVARVEDGKLGASLGAGTSSRCTTIEVPAGHYAIQLDGIEPDELTIHGAEFSEASIDVPRSAELTLTVTVEHARHLRNIQLVRQ